MNQTSLIGRPLYQLTKSLVDFAEKRGIRSSGWSGPLTSSSPELARLWSAPAISTGMNVNESTAFTYSVFWACVNNISTDIGSFPLSLYKRLPNGGKEPLLDHKLHWVLQASPNPEMSAPNFRGLLTSNALTWGKGYAEIIRDGAGKVVELWPITPDRVTERRYTYKPYDLYYDVSRQDGGIDRLTNDRMFVLPGSTYDGVYGRNIVAMARESIGLGLAAERFGGTFFGNGSTFGGFLLHPNRLSPQAYQNLQTSINTEHQGVERAHKLKILEEGMTYAKGGVDPNAAQFVETRQHQVEEMCRWFRMPPHKVQHLIRTSYNSVEQMNIEYSTDTLQPWCVRWEWEIWRQLIAPSERRIQFAKHNMDSKLRGDTAARYEAYAKGIQHGFLCADDIREKEDMNPLPDGAGKKFFFPQNMVPADRVDEVIDKQVAPDPKPVAPAPAAQPESKDDADRWGDTLAEIRAQLAAAEVRIADHALKAAETLAQFRAAEQSEDERDRIIAEHEQRAHEAKVEAAKLQTVKILLEERIASEAMARETERLAAEESLRKAVEEAHVTQETLKAEGQAEVERVRTLLTEAETRAGRLEIERATAETQVVDLTSGLAAVETVLAETRDAAQTDRVKAEAEAQWLKTELAEAQKRSTDLADIKTAAEARVAELQAALDRAEAAVAQERARVEAEAKSAIGEADARVREERARREAEERAAHAESETATAAATIASTAAEIEALKAELVQVAQQRDAAAVASEMIEQERARLLEERAALDASLQQAQNELEQRKAAHATRQQTLIASHRNNVLYAWGLIVAKEMERVKRNAGTPAKLKAWAAAFYLLHEANCVDALRTVMQTHLAFIGSTQDVDQYTRGLIVPELLQARTQIESIASGDVDDFAVSVDRLLARWEHERAAALADAVMQEEITYVRSL